jgi:hypothetical protein
MGEQKRNPSTFINGLTGHDDENCWDPNCGLKERNGFLREERTVVINAQHGWTDTRLVTVNPPIGSNPADFCAMMAERRDIIMNRSKDGHCV